ncbi:hypothetical protein LTR95_010718, partial [Oleoguttula sp. CCFEE 5521]
MTGNENWYEPLLRSRHLFWTRFLALEAGQDQDPIVCKLIPDATVDELKYEALSYAWGISTIKCHIILDGTSGFAITENLHRALHRLRLPNRARLLWVDAICINQTDLLEKASQVAHMDDVYKHAERVLVWLGDCNLYYPELFMATQKILEARERDEWSMATQILFGTASEEAVADFETCTSRSRWRPRYAGAPKALEIGIEEAVELTNNLRLLPTCNPPVPEVLADELGLHMIRAIAKGVSTGELDGVFWWKRIWVVQELLLAQSVVVHCGPYEMNWEDCQAVFAHSSPMSSLDFMRRQYQVSTSRSPGSAAGEVAGGLFDLLRATASSQASDPRDQIYAVMHLTEGEGAYRVQPDYSARPRDVFAAAALHCIITTGTFDVFFHPF